MGGGYGTSLDLGKDLEQEKQMEGAGSESKDAAEAKPEEPAPQPAEEQPELLPPAELPEKQEPELRLEHPERGEEPEEAPEPQKEPDPIEEDVQEMLSKDFQDYAPRVPLWKRVKWKRVLAILVLFALFSIVLWKYVFVNEPSALQPQFEPPAGSPVPEVVPISPLLESAPLVAGIEPEIPVEEPAPEDTVPAEPPAQQGDLAEILSEGLRDSVQ